MAGRNNIDQKIIMNDVVNPQEQIITQHQEPAVAALIAKSAPSKKQAETAKQSLNADYALAPKKIDNNVSKLNLVDAKIEYYMNLINEEQAKGDNANVDLIIRHARTLQGLLSSAAGFSDSQYVRKMNDELDKAIEELQKSYKNKKEMIISIASGTLTILGAGAGVGKIAGATKLVQTLGNVSKGAGAVGQGVGQFGSIARNQEEAVRAAISHLKEKLAGYISQNRQNESGSKNHISEMFRAIMEEIQASRRVFETVASNR